MNFHRTSVIISREYLSRVKKKSFLFITFLAPILFAVLCILPSLIMIMASDKGQSVAVKDDSGVVMSELISSEAVSYVDMSTYSLEDLKAIFTETGFSAVLYIGPFDPETKNVSASVYSEKPLSMDLKDSITGKLNAALKNYRLSLYDIENLPEIMAEIQVDVPLSTYTLSEGGEEKVDASEVYMIVSLVLTMIIYMFIALFSSMVMQGVIEEKASKIVEVLVSSVKATELMFGKIIGVALVALTQFFLWVVLTLLLVGGFSLVAGSFMTPDPAQIEQMSGMMEQMDGYMTSGSVSLTELASSMGEDGEGLTVILTTLAGLPYGKIIICFVLYFVLGFLLYASFFAAIGSAVENEADTGQLQMPVTIPLLIGFFVAFYAFKSPDAAIVQWCSHIPFTSPIVMLARIPYGVGWGEITISVAILAATFVGAAYLSAQIYRVGILTSGKKTTFKDLYRWLKIK